MTRAELAAFFARRSPALRDLSPEILGELARAATFRRYSKGEFLCRNGDPARALWVLIEGRVCVNRCGMTGNRLSIEIMLPGDVFGLPALAALRSPSEIHATQGALAALLPKEAVMRLIDAHPPLARALLLAMARRLHYVTTSLLLSRESLETRAAAALAYLHQKFGPVIPLSRTEIAEMAGAAPESAMRLLKEFETSGLIRRERGRVVVTDFAALKKLSDAA